MDKKELLLISGLLRDKKLRITRKSIAEKTDCLARAGEFFPDVQQKALLIQLLHSYETTKKKVVIVMDENSLPDNPAAARINLGVLAEDWVGMSNSILGIVHQNAQNVHYAKALTMDYLETEIGAVILSFVISDPVRLHTFRNERRKIMEKIRTASQGSTTKTMLLEDETIKFEIYDRTVRLIRRTYKENDLDEIIGEKGEALKFFSSRSREYLQERRIRDLATMIVTNHRFQKMIREGRSKKKIRIDNFTTKDEKLTGITFACANNRFSVDNFLKILDFIVPGYVIKHHKSFVSQDDILVYRIEIVDRNHEWLDPKIIRSIAMALDKTIDTAFDASFTQIKNIGGFEHFARAIIPFLINETRNTRTTQVFFSVSKKTQFNLDLKIIVVTQLKGKARTAALIRRLEDIPGIDITAIVPPRVYSNNVEINVFNLNVLLSEFASINAIFTTLRSVLKRFFGEIRDFDAGIREADLRVLHELLEEFKDKNPVLIRKIFYKLDEIYRIETPLQVLREIMELSHETVTQAGQVTQRRIFFRSKNVPHPAGKGFLKTLLVVSYPRENNLLKRIAGHLEGIETYFSKIEWDQRILLILTLKKSGRALEQGEINAITSMFNA